MNLAYDSDGHGPAILFLHSTVADRRMWNPQWRPMVDAGFRVIRADFPGFGDTPAPEEPNNEADDLRRLLDWLGVDEVAVVAASGGGQVAQEFAARWPRRVWALVLVASAAAYPRERSEALRAFGTREDELLEAGDVDAATKLNVDTWMGPGADGATRALVAEMQRHAFTVQLAAPEVD
ncbi:MAG TPA: alpha/beta hydrolase, partial [Stackebrandtia sp.]|uniref:alpha/beta fold hydrolase n=1 Tax=Stackebrandtia sp. TaxID=2023065 RepID=UPI002D34B342